MCYNMSSLSYNRLQCRSQVAACLFTLVALERTRLRTMVYGSGDQTASPTLCALYSRTCCSGCGVCSGPWGLQVERMTRRARRGHDVGCCVNLGCRWTRRRCLRKALHVAGLSGRPRTERGIQQQLKGRRLRLRYGRRGRRRCFPDRKLSRGPRGDVAAKAVDLVWDPMERHAGLGSRWPCLLQAVSRVHGSQQEPRGVS